MPRVIHVSETTQVDPNVDLAAISQQVSVVIPALNEAAAIEAVVRSVRERLPEIEVIVIDDGSSDGTGNLAEAAGARVIRHDSPQGYGSSLQTGTRLSTREYVLYCDGDGQHTADDVVRIVAELEGFDMVVGKRGRDSHHQLARRPGKRVLRWFADYLAGEKIPDLNSGLRAIRRELILRYLHLMPEGFSFSTTSTFAMLKTHRRIKYIPIKVEARVGQSTVKMFRHGMQTILLMIRLTVLFEPLKVFLTVAGGLFVLTLISLAIDLIVSGAGIGDATVALSMGTLIIFMFGLLCDQVSAIRREKCL
jgi:glycosyltransferase involved in cell wall biosynthesis